MGNKAYTKDQVELVSSHPAFKNAKVLTENDQRRIVTTLPSDDEGYNAWKKLLAKHDKLLAKNHFHLLPKKHTYNKQGLCSHSGNVSVIHLLTQDRLRLLPLPAILINRQQTLKTTTVPRVWFVVLAVQFTGGQEGKWGITSAGRRYQAWECLY